MRRNLVLVASAVVLVAGVGSAVIVAHAASTSSRYEARHGPAAGQFVGYWMGIDPLDGATPGEA
jgi:hypothetical protein